MDTTTIAPASAISFSPASDRFRIGLVGLGYVGLPLAVKLAKTFSVVGFDLNQQKISTLSAGQDPNGEITNADLAQVKIAYTNDPVRLDDCNFIIVAVPTPVHDDTKKPDLTLVESASRLVGEHIRKGTIVMFESTVYPGVTEEICQPIIEQVSGLTCGQDWKIGYSPERVNPGDKEHTIDKIVKVISGMDRETLEAAAIVYGSFTKVHRAPNIKTAEAAKVIENIQRDLNIALMNELSLIFERLGIKTKDVIEAASTKWNFHPYHPGLVGGHCIGVDPYYLTYRAQQLGYEPEVILAGRSLNDRMAGIVADKVMARLKEMGIVSPQVYVMGLTFKENVKDSRNSKAKELIEELKRQQADVIGWDPFLDDMTVASQFGVKNTPPDQIESVDAVIILSPHHQFKDLADGWYRFLTRGVLFDLTGMLSADHFDREAITYLTL